MSIISLFKAKCEQCGDVYVLATGSAKECNRCATIIALVRPLSVNEVGWLLDAAASADRGTFKIIDTRFQKSWSSEDGPV